MSAIAMSVESANNNADSNERFTVDYRVWAATPSEARARAAAIALEQTVEIPREVVPAGYVEDVILGRVAGLREEAEGQFLARIAYSPDCVGAGLAQLPQLLNVMFGNSSLQKGVKLVNFEASPTLLQRFPGARFGVAGVRQRIRRDHGGLLCAVIKPQGSTSAELAALAHATALAGADIIKEDHGLANQPSAPFAERVAALAEAVARANAQRAAEGQRARAAYFASLAGAGHDLPEMAWRAKAAGADGVLVLPGLHGFGAIHHLSADASFGLPIMAHPSLLGPHVLSANTGFSHGALFGMLMRLAGADISVFPNHGGRFGFSRAECAEIAAHCRDPKGHCLPILPSPGGGMSPQRMPEMAGMYGPDCVYLMGGSLLAAGDGMAGLIASLRDALA